MPSWMPSKSAEPVGRFRNALLTLLESDAPVRYRKLESEARALLTDLEMAHDKVNTLLARLAQRDRRAERLNQTVVAEESAPSSPSEARAHWKAQVRARMGLQTAPRHSEETGT